MLEKAISFIGLIVFLAIAYILSENRKRIDRRLVLWGLVLQFAFAVIILKTAPGRWLFDAARIVMTKLLDFTEYGASFLFGTLSSDFAIGATFAFKVLPTIIFVSSLMGILYYFKIIQAVVKAISFVMERTMKASGVEAFMAASFVFMGIEAITALKLYLRKMTRSELFTVMTCFMSTIAGSVMAAYVSFGASAGHLLAASVMSAPAAIVISKIMIPETESPVSADALATEFKSEDSNVIDAAASGAQDGLKLALTIGAMLLAFVAIIGMIDYLLNFTGTSFESISGYLFSPVAFIMGVPYEDCFAVGKLLGVKVAFNEFLSFQKLQILIESGALSKRAITIATYALCSFANFGSIAILLGSVNVLAPERKREAAKMSIRALIAGSMAGFMTATIAGMLL
ncbi:MAG: NupC/NupG family nucleoside CNT transporter [Proteobacteria bacterium]|nr:NupC/NupG family nucleoside CNT transporter [Pseudomonadota bacterium]